MGSQVVDEVDISLTGSSGKTGQDFPGSFSFNGFVATRELTGNDGRTKGPFGTIIGGFGR